MGLCERGKDRGIWPSIFLDAGELGGCEVGVALGQRRNLPDLSDGSLQLLGGERLDVGVK